MTDQNRQVEDALAGSTPRDFTISFAPDGRGLWVLFETGAVLELALAPEQMHALGIEMVAMAGLLVRPPALLAAPAHDERTQ